MSAPESALKNPSPTRLGPFISCRHMEKTRPMREEMDAKGIYFPPESAFSLLILFLYVLFPICTLTWRTNKHISRQGRGINKKNESTNGHKQYTVDSN